MSLRFIIISSFLLFIIASTLFTASRYKGENKAGFVASDEEVRPKNVYVVAAAAAAREKTLRGRKMVVDKTILLEKKAKTNVVARGKQTSFRRITLSENKKNVNFVAFTEDYHAPRHHPPKNN